MPRKENGKPLNGKNGEQQSPYISSISVTGFKSIATEQTIDVRPMTLLAGANSSGKSSMMQAILLLKQTLEASYDPGPLLLNGPNVRFTVEDQMLFQSPGKKRTDEFRVRIGLRTYDSAEVIFHREPGKGFHIGRCIFAFSSKPPITVSVDMGREEIISLTPYAKDGLVKRDESVVAKVVRDRCFLCPVLDFKDSHYRVYSELGILDVPKNVLQDAIHVPGLRGNPERSYRLTATGPKYPGTFENYTASIVAEWSKTSTHKLHELARDLSSLDLTWKIETQVVDATQVELRVGRLRKSKQGGKDDLVNIADVGFGVSQVLPVLVALLAASPGQLVYIEQPEIHLHPRAQVAMASLLAKAANRGVRVVAETHSSLLLLGVQSQVAEGMLKPDLVKLHWFKRDDTTGATTITSADMDEAGRFGDWPEDFDDVTLKAQAHYLDAAEALPAQK